MENKNVIIRAEKQGKKMALEFKGDMLDLCVLYQQITAHLFGCFAKSAKGDDKETIARNAVEGMIHIIVAGIGKVFDDGEGDQKLKPFIKDALKEHIKGLDVSIDAYLSDKEDAESRKKMATKLLGELREQADAAAEKGDIEAMLDVLGTLADLVAAVERVEKENTK